MRKRSFRLLRKRFTNKLWLTQKYRQLLDVSHELNSFYDFECSEFFRGHALAAYNYEIYLQNSSRNDARLKYIKQHLDSL
jgi:hypothetical protein